MYHLYSTRCRPSRLYFRLFLEVIRSDFRAIRAPEHIYAFGRSDLGVFAGFFLHFFFFFFNGLT